MFKIIKKHLCLCMIMSLLLAVNLCVSTAYASDWECTSLPENSSICEADDESIRMYFQTENSEGKAHAQKTVDFSSNESICLSFKMKFEGTDSDILRRLNLQNGSLKTTELLRIAGADLKVFGTDAGTLEEGKEYRVEIGIQKNSGTAIAWLDSEIVYSGELGSKWKSFDYSSLAVLFRNATSAKISTTQSSWTVSDLVMSDNTNGFASVPSDGELVESSTQSIDVIYKGAKSPAVFGKSNYTLTANGESVEFDVQRKGNTLKVIPIGGMISGKEYILTICEITDIFGNVEDTDKAIVFNTAGESYVKADIQIYASEYEFYDNQSTIVNITTTTENEIIDSVVYVNGEVYKTYQGKAESFVFEGESGTYEIYVKSTDEFGGESLSDTITINILHNNPPEFEQITVENGEYNAEKLKSIEVLAVDTDGAVKTIDLYVNNELYTSIAGNEGIVDLSTLEYGIYMLKFVATDDMGVSTEEERTITILRGYNSSKIFSSDFNTYVSDGTVNPGFSFSLYGDAQLISSKDYGEEHGTVVLLKTEGQKKDGNTAHGSWGNFPVTGANDGFEMEMDINLVNDKSLYYFRLTKPSDSKVASIDVLIKNGILYLRDNGSDAVTKTLTPGTWYTIDYKVDILNHTYSFSLDGELLADAFEMGNKTFSQMQVRFTMDFVNQESPVPCGIAFDNLVINSISPKLQITEIEGNVEPQSAKISPDASELKITLNAEVLATRLNSESIKLYCEGENVEINIGAIEESKTKTLTIELLEKLWSNHSYKIVMNDSVVSGGISVEFVTGYNDVDASIIKMTKNGQEAYIEGTIENSTANSEEVYVIVNVFDGIKLVNVSVEKVKAKGSTQTPFKTAPIIVKEDETTQVYVWDSLINPSPVVSRTYMFN